MTSQPTPRRTFVEIHAIQELPSHCINRDDSGAPKEANVGGTRRARVSSQAWKKVVRKHLRDHIETNKTLLTIKQPELVGQRVKAALPHLAEAEVVKAVNEFFDKGLVPGISTKSTTEKDAEVESYAVSKALFASTDQELQDIADHVVKVFQIDSALDAKKQDAELKVIAKSLKDTLKGGVNSSYENALFGRFAASDNSFNIDASSQFAAAIGTHPLIPEVDFYTALDDISGDHNGSAMMGDVEYNSSVVYRYANIDVDALRANLKVSTEEEIGKLVEVFIQGFAETMPSGRQNGFPARTRPNVIIVTVGDAQPFVLTTLAFSRAVTGINRVEDSAAKLGRALTQARTKYELGHDETYFFELDPEDSKLSPEIGTEVETISSLTSVVGKTVQERLESK